VLQLGDDTLEIALARETKVDTIAVDVVRIEQHRWPRWHNRSQQLVPFNQRPLAQVLAI
jgi:hypothetical protein